MLQIKNGRFHAPGVSFLPPDGSYLDYEPEVPREYGITVWLHDDISLDIYADEGGDPLTDLQDLFSEDGSRLYQDTPIEEMGVGGMEGYEVRYHDSKSDYYECRLLVSEEMALAFYFRCPRGTVDNLRELPERKVVLHNIQKE